MVTGNFIKASSNANMTYPPW